ncbi:MAG: tetratricopeptide repeat protein [Planctomycetaceae bacterium]|nr:tetratricopeptide repeat protein [Planctomycetaceae bacterium]
MEASPRNLARPTVVAPAPTNRRRSLPLRKKVLFSLMFTAMFFVAMELLLAALGVKPLTATEDPFVGFTSHSPLFEQIRLTDGDTVYRTVEKKIQWFNPQEFPTAKGTNDYRIFCVGGSTTYGRPYNDKTSFSGWLREYLRAADSQTNWEVINAGGISYASYRVASLMEELIEYEPDLFIIYSGQNEFLERRTYGDLMDTPNAVRETAAVLAKSRVYSSIHALMNRSDSGGSEPTSGTYKLPEEVEAILDGSVGPDDYQRDNEQRQQIISHYRFNLARMIEIARSVGARVIMVNPAVNERHMSPFKSQHSEGLNPEDLARWDQLIAQAKSQEESGELEAAIDTVNLALEIDPLFAQTHFDRGRILYELERYPEAKQSFQRAIDEDVCPLRMLSDMHPALTEVASEYKIPLVDFQSLLEQKTETGITGDESFLDHVHPTIDGYRELAWSLFETLESEGIVHPGSQWTDEKRLQVERTVMESINERDHGIALRNLGKVLSWARKYEEAGRLAQLASSKLSDDAEVHCMAGYDFERNGQLKQAIKSYQKAIEIKPDYAQAHYNLGHVHRQLEEWELAAKSFQKAIESDPNYPGAHYNLGLIYQKANRLNLASECFETSTAVNDKHPGSWEELGNVRLNQGQFEEAIRHLQKAIDLDPNLASAHNSLGVVFAQRGELQKAVASFEQALAISPNFESAQQNLDRAKKLLN